jgi:F0F1-type ATP synthase assembly protein I
MQDNPDRPPAERLKNFALAATAAQGGCASAIVIIGALLIGLALDAHLHTRPAFTLIFILLSVPVSLVVMFTLVLGATRNITPTLPPTTPKKEDRTWQEKD